jgi:hypothetical protein
MLAGQSLDLDHATPLIDDPTSRASRIVHAACNRRRHNRGADVKS